MSSASRLILILGMCLTLFGCGQLPQPFIKAGPVKDRADLLIPKASEGVDVLPLEGVDKETGVLTAELASVALQKRGLTATVGLSTRASYALFGTGVRQKDGSLEIAWFLSGPNGQIIGDTTASVASDEELAASLDVVADWILPKPPQSAFPKGSNYPPISVVPVVGAPGDGNRLLQIGLSAVLRQRGLEVASQPVPENFKVRGSVAITPAQKGFERVAVKWQVLTASGQELGVIDQVNDVPRGSLDEKWGSVAGPIALGAADGILALLDQTLPTLKAN